MALSDCLFIGSIQRDCRDSAGGLIEIKARVLPSLTSISNDYTVTSGTVTIASASRTPWYTWYLEPGTASWEEVVTPNKDNGTVTVTQTLTVVFNKMSTAMRQEIAVMSKNSIQFAIRDRNDVYSLLGYEFGMDMETSTGGSGTKSEDRNGYVLVFKATERVQAPNMAASTYNSLVTA